MNILLIEDEEKVSAFIKRGLEHERYNVDTAFNGTIGLKKAQHSSNDLIILDLMLPEIDGLSLLRQLRENEIQTPVLILTAKDSIEDRIQGLNLGADDYLAKPFSFGELLARVRALLRRSQKKAETIVTIKDLKVDLMTHEVFRNNVNVDLTAREYDLLEFFINNQNRAINRITITEHVWQYDFDPGTNFIDVYINRLRKKINDTGESKLIHTVRGYGYILKTH
jgi:DNA-binding response OmpR family regulator